MGDVLLDVCGQFRTIFERRGHADWDDQIKAAWPHA